MSDCVKLYLKSLKITQLLSILGQHYKYIMHNGYDNSIHFRHGGSDYEFYLTRQ